MKASLPAPLREAAALYVGCIAGALPQATYVGLITKAGFADICVAASRDIALPEDLVAEALAAHMSDAEIAAFQASGIGVKSITVTGTRPDGAWAT